MLACVISQFQQLNLHKEATLGVLASGYLMVVGRSIEVCLKPANILA